MNTKGVQIACRLRQKKNNLLYFFEVLPLVIFSWIESYTLAAKGNYSIMPTLRWIWLTLKWSAVLISPCLWLNRRTRIALATLLARRFFADNAPSTFLASL